MRTNIDIDDALMAEAQEVTGLKTKRETVEFALREVIRRRRAQVAIRALRGTGWEGDLEAMRLDHPEPGEQT